MVDPTRTQLSARLALCSFFALALGLSTGYHPVHLLFLAALGWYVDTKKARLCVLVFGLVGFAFRVTPAPLEFESKRFQGEVRVVSVPWDSGGNMKAVADSRGKRYLLTFPKSIELNLGDLAEVGGIQRPIAESRRAPDGRVAEVELIGGVRKIFASPAAFGWGIRIRHAFVDWTEKTLPKPIAATVDALCMGSGEGMTDDQWEIFRRTGTIHVIVASGIHAVLAAGAALGALKRVPMRRELKLCVVLVLLLVYAAAAGFRPPILRGVVMSLASYGHYWFGRRNDPLNSMGIAGIASLVLDPWAVFDLGLWLSCAAVAGITMAGQTMVFEEFADAKAWLASLWNANIAATIATFPLLAFAIGQVSLIGIVASMIAVPVMEASLVAALTAFGIGVFLPPLGAVLMRTTVEPAVGGLLVVLDGLSRLPVSVVTFGSFSAYWLIPIYLGLAWMWRPARVEAT